MNPTKTGGELRCSGSVGSSCSTSDTRHVDLVTNPMISHEWGKFREVLTTSGTYLGSSQSVTQIFHKSQPSRGGDRTPQNFRNDDFNLTKRNPCWQQPSNIFIFHNSYLSHMDLHLALRVFFFNPNKNLFFTRN